MFHIQWLPVLALSAALIFFILWRGAVHQIRAQAHVWSAMLPHIASRNYEAALSLAGSLSVDELAALKSTIESLRTRELEQQSARRELEDVLASLQDAVLVVDSEARLRFLNAAALGLFEVRVEDVLGAHMLEALPSFELEMAVGAALRQGRDSAHEIRLNTPRTREVLLRATPVRQSSGAVSGAVAILQDLTEMHRLERVRRDFVANASHELRTPIANIRAVAETLLDDLDDSALIRRFLPQLVHEAELLSRLVSDLLDLARAESSAPTSVVPVDLVSVIYETIQRLRDKAIQRRIEVKCEIDDTCRNGAPVLGDMAALEQVVFNLLDNALIYASGGTVTLRLEAQNAKGERLVVLSISDTGSGIPVDDLPRIFERFYRVDKARARAQGGTGLGLAIVKHIIENHGGHVQVESDVGHGTTFTVTLPAP